MEREGTKGCVPVERTPTVSTPKADVSSIAWGNRTYRPEVSAGEIGEDTSVYSCTLASS